MVNLFTHFWAFPMQKGLFYKHFKKCLFKFSVQLVQVDLDFLKWLVSKSIEADRLV